MAKSLFKKRDLRAILWLDSCNASGSGWRGRKEVAKLTPVKMYTVGFVVKETDKYIVVVGTLGQDDHHLGEFCIPKGTIVKMETVTLGI